MNRLPSLALLTLCIAASSTLVAQGPPKPDTARQRSEIAKLSWMIGEWEGEAWSQRGAERTEIRQVESVKLRLDGLALLVEGEGTAKGDPSKVLFRALGIVYFDSYALAPRLASWTGEGHGAVTPMTINPNGFAWEITAPSGKVRYTATHAGGVWTEIGEWSADGAAWSKFFEMTLRRKG